MANKIMSINAGSSSLKFQLFEMPEEELLVKGLFERIGLEDQMIFSYSMKEEKVKTTVEGRTHEAAINFLLRFLLERKILTSLDELSAVGHRVAHGGEEFKTSSLVDQNALIKIKDLGKLAPLHNPVNVVGIEALKKSCLIVLKSLFLIRPFIRRWHQKIISIHCPIVFMKRIMCVAMVSMGRAINLWLQRQPAI